MKKIMGWLGVGNLLLFVVVFGLGVAVSKNTEEECLSLQDSHFPSLHIAHLSDLHFPENGIPLEELTERVKNDAPDFIFLTGDIIQDGLSEEKFPVLESFLKTLSAVAPCYMVLGNHEIGYQNLEKLYTVIRKSGINLLKNEVEKATIRGKTFLIGGLSDAYPFSALNMSESEKAYPLLLLAHRPEKADSYCRCENPSCIAFCGHAHGGAVRIGKQGVFAPDQGLFPEYTSGLYEVGKLKMVVSRGLGKKGKMRLYNPYHIPLISVSGAEG